MKLLVGLVFVAVAFGQPNQIVPNQTIPNQTTPNQITGVMGGIVGPVPTASIRVGSFSSISGNSIGNTNVTGQPYSAEEIREQVQTLGDGTRITQPVQKSTIYRDSQGRTRTERTIYLPAGAPAQSSAPVFVEIVDPVAGVRYSLDPNNHTARQTMTTRPLLPPPPPPPPAPGVANGRIVAQAQLTQQIYSPAIRTQTQGPQFSRESLGSRTIEGVLAEGTRTTTVFPAESIGNDRPITVTSENWSSPELQIFVLQKNSDPRSGESTTTLTNISRAEPGASLFQVPADHEIIPAQH